MRKIISFRKSLQLPICVIFILAFYNYISSATIVVPDDYKTISLALTKAKSKDTIQVKDGVYREQIKLSSGITLVSRSLFKAVINGTGVKNAVIMGNKSTLSGFEIKNAQIGVYSEGTENTITKCYIHDNNQTGITCVGHLPKIEDNIIANNKGSGIQGWDVRSTISTINHNTIAYNVNHGISVGGKSDIVIENNIIAFNTKLGLKVEPEVKIKLVKNNFYSNGDLFPTLPEDNFSFEPKFVAVSAMNFMLSEESKCRKMASDTEDLGARIIY
jgi:hypothetical protein